MATKNARTILWGVDSTGEMREVGVYDDGAGGYTLVAPGAVGATVDVSDRAARLLGKLSANSGVDIGDVDVTSLPVGNAAMAASTPVTVASDDTLITALKTALEAIQSTAGIKKITDALPAGSNAIGKLAANSGVDIGDVDVTSLPVGNAAMAASTPVTIASDDTLITALKTALEIMDDWDESDRAKVNLISGQAGVAGGSGVAGATVLRTVESLDSPLPLSLGITDQANMGVLAFDASSTVTLDASSTYQIIATEDCHFHLTDGTEAATTSHMFLPANQYFILRTGSTIRKLYAIKSVTAGNIHYCKMLGNE